MYSYLTHLISIALGALTVLMVFTAILHLKMEQLKASEEELRHTKKIYEKYTKHCRKLLREKEGI